MVTFTEAAAGEMKERIQKRLLSILDQTTDVEARRHLDEQIALLDTAAIGTIHSFCLRLIREHFHEFGIDPQVSVLAQEQSRLMMNETFDVILENHYSGSTQCAQAVQELIEVQARGRDQIIRNLVFQIHNYARTRADSAGWFHQQLEQFSKPEPTQWIQWLFEQIYEWREHWIPALNESPEENDFFRTCSNLLSNLPNPFSREQTGEILSELLKVDKEHSWKGKKGKLRKPFNAFFDEAEFFRSLVVSSESGDPIAQDWSWVRGQMETLLMLSREFSVVFADAKREEGVVDFHDLEQFALQLLWNHEGNKPSDLSRWVQQSFKSVFVDEYQDINPAQDRIIQALSGGGSVTNRFLVGDVKQSIYGFRLADPRIFQEYRKEWTTDGSEGRVIFLSENFRSRESLLRFINMVFEGLMREGLGGVAYEAEDALKFGTNEQRNVLAHTEGDEPRVEFHLQLSRRKSGGNATPEHQTDETSNSDADPSSDPGQVEQEARFVAKRLIELISDGHQIWDSETNEFRPVKWSDMAILLRSIKDKGEIYAKEFQRLGVPLRVPQAGFFDRTEVSDLVCLLQLLDNPLQDAPLLAVLRSPLVSLTVNDLVEIRTTEREAPIWTALRRWHNLHQNAFHESEHELDTSKAANHLTDPESDLGMLWYKIDRFLGRFQRWRRMAREASLSQRLESVLDETHYEDWLLSRAHGRKRVANVRKLLSLTREFDPLQRCGLQRFLQSVDIQRQSEIDNEPSDSGQTDSVTLTTIHKSKGLEYPVVVIADLGKRFNLRDLTGDIVLDEKYGLCPLVKPPFTGRYYPSLPCWLARRRQRREALGEELRLLYVGTTRARDTLILVGTASEQAIHVKWPIEASQILSDQRMLSASCLLDWLGPLLIRNSDSSDWTETPTGQSTLFSWRTYEAAVEICPSDFAGDTPAHTEELASILPPPNPERLEELKNRADWRYPFISATVEPAKSAVTALGERLRSGADESNELFREDSQESQRRLGDGKLSGAEIGTAHHLFLQLVSLDRLGNASDLQSEATRLQEISALSPQEAASLDLSAIEAFWKSPPGTRILGETGNLHRELPFTARFSLKELNDLLGSGTIQTTLAEGSFPSDDLILSELTEEFIILQGIVDLAVIRSDDIWLLDYKTDTLTIEGLTKKTDKYRSQLQLYVSALERIYRKPVTFAWLHFLSLRQTISIFDEQNDASK